jgi:oxygen-dependent protoporphyrinogen oxidase
MSDARFSGWESSTRRSVAVVGGGISGLAAAYHLQRLSRDLAARVEVRLFESARRLGGQIRTERADGALFEGGPESLLAQKAAGIELCRHLGLDDELQHVGGGGATMQLVSRGRLVHLPEGFLMLAPTRVQPFLRSSLLTWPGKVRMLSEVLLPPKRDDDDDESLRAFVTRRFGHEAFEKIAEPIIAGLFTADADTLSMRMTMPRFLQLEQRHGSVIRGLVGMRRKRKGSNRALAGTFVSPRDGMERLVDRLASELPRDRLMTGVGIESLQRDPGSGSWLVRPAAGPVYRADAVVLALPAFAGARLVEALDDRLAGLLGRLDYASCATVNLVYRRSDLAGSLESYGFFVPRSEGLPILACNFVSAKFSGRVDRDKILLRAFLGGALRPDALDRDDAELITEAHEALAGLLPLAGKPLVARVHRAPRAMPQFRVGHQRTVESIESRLNRHPGLFLCGSATGAFGIPDCAGSGERAARKIVEFVAGRGRRLELAI